MAGVVENIQTRKTTEEAGMSPHKRDLVVTMIHDTTANPAPLGLCGFGLTTVLLNFANAGVFSLGSMILAMGLFYGGIAQMIAGIMEWRKKNTFGTTAFLSYGAFWLTLVALVVLPKMGWAAAPDKNAMVAYLAIWGLFSLGLFIGTFRLSKALQFVFLTLTVLYALLAAGEATGSATIKLIAGIEGIVCGLSAIYTGIGLALNEVYGRSIFPLGTVK